jgi:hypothetical protein
MALSDNDKNLLITQLEVALDDAQAGAGVTSSLDEIETAIAALRTAYTADPASVTAQALLDAKAMVVGCKFGDTGSATTVWAEAVQDAG